MSQVIESNELVRVVNESGLLAESSKALMEAFQPFFNDAMTIRAQADGISVTDATQVSEMREARTKRLALAAVRVAAEKQRKALKEDSLKTGKAIDKVASVIDGITAPAEARLLEMEKFAERAEAARKAALAKSRYTLLAPFVTDMTGYDLGGMPEATFTQLLDSNRTAHEARVAAAQKAEAERIAAEAAKAEEDKRIRAENERIRLELEAERRKAAAEREAADKAKREAEAKAAAERKAIEDAAKREREALQAKASAEAKAAADKAKAEREAVEAKARAEREAAELVARKEREALEAKHAAEQKAAREKAAKAEAKRREEAALIEKGMLAVIQEVRDRIDDAGRHMQADLYENAEIQAYLKLLSEPLDAAIKAAKAPQ